MNDLILAIDVGTQSVRSILFDLQGEIEARERVAIDAHYPVKPGWAEQRPEYYYEKLCESTKKLLSGRPELVRKIKGCSITTQRSTLVNVDKNGYPLRPAIVWPDQRRTNQIRPLRGIMGTAIRLIGMLPTVQAAQRESEINWLNHYQPKIMEQTHKYLFLSGYLLYRLTGRFVDSHAAQVGYVPFDYRHFAWCKPGAWQWDAFPIEAEKLPELIPPAAIAGSIGKKVSEETEIPEGMPVVTSGSDKTCEFLGAGCLSLNQAGISLGTTATIGVYHKKYFESIPLIPPYSSAVPGMYNTEFQIYRGLWLVSWFKNEFGEREVKRAMEENREPEELLEQLLGETPPGALGLILQPTWSPGVKIPGPEAKGSIIGFGDAHTRAHLYRAIIEGLCYGLKSGGERIQKKSRVPFTEIRVSGGGAQSEHTLQITADIFNLPVKKPHIHDTSSLGAAMDCAVGLGLISDFNAAVCEMTRIEREYEPDQSRVALYEKLYRDVYIHIYEKLAPYYQRIREITGYPD